MSGGRRFLVLLAAVALLAATGTLAVLHAAGQARGARADGPPVRAGTVTLGAQPDGPRLVFRSMTWGPDRDELAFVPLRHPDDTRTAASAPTCLRFHAAAGTGICLQAVHGLVQDGYRAVVLDAALHEVRHYDLAGIPTRARVSPSGHLVRGRSSSAGTPTPAAPSPPAPPSWTPAPGRSRRTWRTTPSPSTARPTALRTSTSGA
ncbi:hypothetical protein KAURM247S_02744 [Kitasatospora aureofaciens]